jgi:hypothetical protein
MSTSTKDLQICLSKLNHASTCVANIFPRKVSVEDVNPELAHYYSHVILRFKHIICNTLKVPEVMTHIYLCYQYMQLYERLSYKNKKGERLEHVVDALKTAIKLYESYVSATLLRLWRHPKIGVLADLNVNVIKMFKMNFLIRQSSM